MAPLLELSSCIAKSGLTGEQQADRRGGRGHTNPAVPPGTAISLFSSCPEGATGRKGWGEGEGTAGEGEGTAGEVWQQPQQAQKPERTGWGCGVPMTLALVREDRGGSTGDASWAQPSRPLGSSRFLLPWPARRGPAQLPSPPHPSRAQEEALGEKLCRSTALEWMAWIPATSLH